MACIALFGAGPMTDFRNVAASAVKISPYARMPFRGVLNSCGNIMLILSRRSAIFFSASSRSACAFFSRVSTAA